MNNRNPWAWVPTLYFAEGVPYVAVMTISVIIYKRLGLSNTDITLYTSWLYLPWVIKPLWSPFVDMLRTADTHRRRTGRRGLHHTRTAMAARVIGILLVAGLF